MFYSTAVGATKSTEFLLKSELNIWGIHLDNFFDIYLDF